MQVECLTVSEYIVQEPLTLRVISDAGAFC